MADKKQGKNKPVDIDEEYIMEAMALSNSGTGTVLPSKGTEKPVEGTPGEPESTETSEHINDKGKPEVREYRKKRTLPAPVEYEGQFIKRSDLTVRSGKGVYIRADYHNNINRIISIIGNNGISITDYLDNVLAYHFESFEQEITEIFNQRYKPIIK
ncbi:DUF3408 domain-containing protein [Proteiniphilum sp. UBA5346]|uniref:DUF3408 domain-containing protein n=1 Tax=Proteiniphilum sp. UBA5346 TaxID=1947277 RepID=UPI00257FD676|nr:DUF3408 domain-containing protein [Proteiniphilum sp. UBA5346]